MRRPTLSALRAFEATARLGSMRKAALELQIDHAVISRHIKDVEAELGVELLKRGPNKLELSELGRFLSQKTSGAFAEIDQAVSQTRDAAEHSILYIACIHGFAQRWLMPRLDHFSSRHPSIELRLRATDEMGSIEMVKTDLEIKYVCDKRLDRDWYVIARPNVFPVVAQDVYQKLLSQGCKSLPDFLQHIPLIHELNENQWSKWLNGSSINISIGKKGIVLSNANMAIEAAILGKGIALANDLLVSDELTEGRLATLHQQPIKLNAYAVHILSPQTKLKNKQVFCDWLSAQVKYDCQHKV
jgi:LysR family transcriptional regulator, glycine cleavage system transcriptional activator